jgi:hypothetical protein
MALVCDKDIFTGAHDSHPDTAGNEESPVQNREERTGICTR